MADQTMMMELGSTGLKRTGGIIEEEFLRELSGEKWRRTVIEMRENDPIIGAILYAIEMTMRQVTWEVLPGSDDPGDKAAADFVAECLYDMSQDWTNNVNEILSMLEWGWSYFNTVYKMRRGPDQTDGKYRSRYNDGRIGWRKWAIRAQETLDEWAFDEEGGIAGLWQIAPPTYQRVFIPIDQALLFRTSTRKGNPEGRSLLRSAYRAWFRKKNIENTEGTGVERDLAGLPVAWVPPGILDPSAGDDIRAARIALQNVVVNIRRDAQEGVLFPLAYDDHGNKLYDLSLMTSGGSRQFDTDKIIRREDQHMAMSVLADFILIGHESVGSFALSSNKTALFNASLTAYLDMMGGVSKEGRPLGVINQYGIPRLLRLNKMAVKEQPMLSHGDVAPLDLVALGNFVSQLAGAGMPLFPNAELEAAMMERAGLPYTIDDLAGGDGDEGDTAVPASSATDEETADA